MDSFQKTTESDSHYEGLENMSVSDLLKNINREDQTVAKSVEKTIPAIEALVQAILPNFTAGGRLFYIGAGTSGRLGIVDASECPPTFGVEHGKVVGLIAGGDSAIRKAVEFAEDDSEQAWKDLSEYQPTEKDALIGIAASGTTPYVIGGLDAAKAHGMVTGCITCNEGSPITQACEFPIEAVVGPEFVTGSTRMKAGTAQKLILNMISTSLMIGLGRIQGNKMVDMQLSNHKLVGRGTRMVMEATGLDVNQAEELLLEKGSVRAAVEHHKSQKS
ncbi:MAG: N-acetylmuramic acid 6-phosphate etherase [Schleiferiaceae bacterium]